MTGPCIQFDSQGKLKHFLSIEGLRREHLQQAFDLAETFSEISGRAVKKVPLLRGKIVANLFFEPSTRTRTTFELAAKRLSADVLNISPQSSAVCKGESMIDMLSALRAMHCDVFVIRHSLSGVAHYVASRLPGDVAVINAGDGCHEHPTQALLDLFTIRRYKPDFPRLRVAIIGDIAHSRVARSQILALNLMGVREVRVVGPKTLIPTGIKGMGAQVHLDLDTGLKNVDVVIVLRLQRERMNGPLLPGAEEYFFRYGLTRARLAVAAEDAIVMHPGPINRGVELDSEVADDPRSLILEQVSHGIAIRMAIMALTTGAPRSQSEN